MLKITLWLLVGVLAWRFGSSSISCPDGSVCPDSSTCCQTTQGYRCCPYPKAVCCSDLAHCCPAGFLCNLSAQTCDKKTQPWMSIPMVKKEPAEEPKTIDLSVTPFQELRNDQKQSAVIYCDNIYTCPNGYTCCRHPGGAWFCCPYSPGYCCLDGYHCCPYGYTCDWSYQYCVRTNLEYPFPFKRALSSAPASRVSPSEDKSSLQETPMTALTEARGNAPEIGVIRCDSSFYCSPGSSCCKGSSGQWNCCPYPLGQCCLDGKHCCQYGYNCDASSSSCRRWYSQVPSGPQEQAETD